MNPLIVARNFASSCKKGMQRRKLLSSPFHSRFGNQKSVLLTESRTHINNDKRYVYSRVPKAANSTVIASLYEGEGDTSDRDYIEGVKGGDILPSELIYNKIDEIFENYFIFSFVRNPFFRIVSCYNDKIVRPGIFRKIVSMRKFYRKDADISFDDFLDFLSNDSNLYLDAHWAPQYSLMAFPLERYNFIGRVERLDQDLKYLLESVGKNGGLVDYRPHATGTSGRLANVTESQARKIVDIYHNDFIAFGYLTQLPDARNQEDRI